MSKFFDVQKLKVLDGKVYEKDGSESYRQILSSDDYDYVEDDKLYDELENEEFI